MIEPNQMTRPRWCPRCRARMRVRPNPYYGVGLAVHNYLSTCPRCGLVEFLPRVPRHAESAPAVAPVSKASPASFAQRVLALAARLFAAPR